MKTNQVSETQNLVSENSNAVPESSSDQSRRKTKKSNAQGINFSNLKCVVLINFGVVLKTLAQMWISVLAAENVDEFEDRDLPNLLLKAKRDVLATSRSVPVDFDHGGKPYFPVLKIFK